MADMVSLAALQCDANNSATYPALTHRTIRSRHPIYSCQRIERPVSDTLNLNHTLRDARPQFALPTDAEDSSQISTARDAQCLRFTSRNRSRRSRRTRR